MILKKIEKKLRNLYKKHKDIFLLGGILEYIRILSLNKKFKSAVLKYFIIPEIKEILNKNFKEQKKEIKAFLKEAISARCMVNEFSKWRSGDYDVILLYCLIRLMKPETVVETGISSGRSSTAILEALQMNEEGKLYSVDFPKIYNGERPGKHVTINGEEKFQAFVPDDEEAPGWLVSDNLKNRWQMILGNSREELPKLTENLRKIDIFYHDSDHTYETMMFEFETVWNKIPKNGFLLADDISENNAFKDFTSEVNPSFSYIYNGLGLIKK